MGKNGIDVVYDGVGIKTFKGSIETLKIRGMMVAFGNASGYVDTIDVKKDINAKGLFFTRPSIAHYTCLLYTSPSPRDSNLSRMPSSA